MTRYLWLPEQHSVILRTFCLDYVSSELIPLRISIPQVSIENGEVEVTDDPQVGHSKIDVIAYLDSYGLLYLGLHTA